MTPADWAPQIPFLIVGYGFGASFVALFAQLGGGIYTKAADVGADLVGKVEAGIPEDDPRNPAVIADLVGDNVGDCAGRGADLFESTAAENIGAMILGVFLYRYFGIPGILFPLVAGAFGLIASIIGVMTVKHARRRGPDAGAQPRVLHHRVPRACWASRVRAAGCSAHRCRMRPMPGGISCCAGSSDSLMSVAFLLITQYYTEYAYRPVKAIAEASQTGPATNIIQGIAVGHRGDGAAGVRDRHCDRRELLRLAATAAWWTTRGSRSVGCSARPSRRWACSGTVGYVLAMDTFGPITDNAGGIIEMSQQPESVRAITDRLDAVGNTTKALTKGYAIGSAALAAFLLFSAYLDEVFNYTGQRVVVNIARPELFVAGLLGAMLVFWFSSLAIKAVGRAAYSVINEVRRQFKEKPGIMQGTDVPDYGRVRGHRDDRRAQGDGGAGRARRGLPDRRRAGVQDLRSWVPRRWPRS